MPTPTVICTKNLLSLISAKMVVCLANYKVNQSLIKKKHHNVATSQK